MCKKHAFTEGVTEKRHGQWRDILKRLLCNKLAVFGQVFSAVSKRGLPRLERMIREIDPESFVVVGRVSKVRGRGFSVDKGYR